MTKSDRLDAYCSSPEQVVRLMLGGVQIIEFNPNYFPDETLVDIIDTIIQMFAVERVFTWARYEGDEGYHLIRAAVLPKDQVVECF